MIIDTLENLTIYQSLNSRFADVAAFISTHDLRDMPAGHYEIDGPDFFVNVQEGGARPAEDAVLEYHRRMIDVQIPLHGPETYGYTPVSRLPEVAFDEANDVALLPGVAPESYVTCQQGEFAVFLPTDGHAPCIAEKEGFKKAIFKIRY